MRCSDLLNNALGWYICNKVNIALADMAVIFAKRSEIKENRKENRIAINLMRHRFDNKQEFRIKATIDKKPKKEGEQRKTLLPFLIGLWVQLRYLLIFGCFQKLFLFLRSIPN